MNKLISIVAVALTFFLSACGTTDLRDVWQEPDFHKRDFQNVIVVGMTTNITNRTVFEREFVDELEKKDIAAIESYKVIGKKAPSKEALLAYIKDHQVDYVLVTHVAGQEIKTDYIDPKVINYSTGPWGGTRVSSSAIVADGGVSVGATTGGYYGGYYGGYRNLGGYWGAGSTVTVQTPGYFEETSYLVLATTIYDTKTLEAVWSARTATYEAKSVSFVTDEVAEIVVEHIHR